MLLHYLTEHFFLAKRGKRGNACASFLKLRPAIGKQFCTSQLHALLSFQGFKPVFTLQRTSHLPTYLCTGIYQAFVTNRHVNNSKQQFQYKLTEVTHQ